MNTRKEGYYWVKNREQWEVAQWDINRQQWYLPDVQGEYIGDDAFTEINETRIPAPDEKVSEK